MRLQQFKEELEKELEDILSYWMKYAVDETYGGFAGRVDHLNHRDTQADKGSVLNSRILWTFSAAFRHTQKNHYGLHAQRAYGYFMGHFIDPQYGGVYWSVDYRGAPANRKKQVYAQSFALYAMSEFFMATGLPAAREQAIALFNTIEQFSFDKERGGYIDAFAEDWLPLEDMSLSDKDANEKKTMNTHLHVLEAYSNLYRIWPEPVVREKIKNLLQNFADYIIDGKTGHLVLFFNEAWIPKAVTVSYGHDIEAAWLLQEAADSLGDIKWKADTRNIAVKMANSCLEGLDTDGGLWYEYEPAENHLVKEKHWWPQAEAMVGFFNAWQESGQQNFLQAAINVWDFIKEHIRDDAHGEWVWGIRADGAVMTEKDKIGIWKCPYHNGRACMEMIRRVQQALEKPI